MENRLNEANARPDTAIADGHSSESSSRVQQLETEIQCLKSRLAGVESQKDVSWQQKVAQAESRRAEAEEALANCGVSTIKDPKEPCLVNVNQVNAKSPHPIRLAKWAFSMFFLLLVIILPRETNFTCTWVCYKFCCGS